MLAAATLAAMSGNAWAQYGNVRHQPPSGAGRAYQAPRVRQADPYSPRDWLASQKARVAERRKVAAVTRPMATSRQASYVARAGGGASVLKSSRSSQSQPETLPEPAPELDFALEHDHDSMLAPYDDHGCSDCGHGGCPGGDCGACTQCACWPHSILPCNTDLFAGVHGFKGPRDNGTNGNFGFQEGVNLGGAMPLIAPHWGLGYQVGYQAMQSNLSGRATGSGDLTEARHQSFLTAGLYRRVQRGVQFGVVWDWQHDDYFDQLDLNQIRGEIALVNGRGREIGFWFAAGTGRDDQDQSIWIPTDQFAFFYRWHFCDQGEARLWGGFTGNSDGLFGGDARWVLGRSVSLVGSFNYLIPEESAGIAGATNESWNLGVNLVWTLGGRARASLVSPYRPLMGVADNGTFMVERR